MDEDQQLQIVMLNNLNRGCTTEQTQEFIDRCRRYHLNNPKILQVIDDQEVRHINSMYLELPEGVEA
ncbi:hypothetical protein [Paenibacillus wynnii]|uniref:Uncharacterized protein n=1 Tax=Paenibacillus wynnii TaxID=268407 RepID=A0A098MAB7_9BACL|nr:hypothetical protein [Paenibacillus wynnii]KGE18482.1 hypothetical protein PWYN_03175 [Paenibacillus wynnii]